MSSLFDLKYAVRVLLKRPGFSALAMAVLAVATALSLFMLSFIHTLAFKALPFEDGEDIVVVDALRDGIMYNGGHLSPLDLEELHQSLTGLDEFVMTVESFAILSGRDSARTYQTSRTQAQMFRLTRTEPILGRAFTDAEVRAGGEQVVVISHDVWQSYFGGAGNVIDQLVRVDGETTRIIGVMPPGFRFPYSNDLWLPLRVDTDRVTRGDGVKAMAVARLGEGVSAEEVQLAAHQVMRRLSEAYPDTNDRLSVYVTTIPLSSMGQGMLFVNTAWLTAVFLVVLAAVNVGNLLLSRALERNTEIAIRLALGAPASRLVIQMMWESAIIIFIGAGAGLLLAAWGLEAANTLVVGFLDQPPLFWWRFGPDPFVWSVFAAMVIGMLMLAGVFPALRAAGTDYNSALRDGAHNAFSRKNGRISLMLVITECMLSVAILIAAGVVIANSYKGVRADYGVEPEGIFTARINLPENRYSSTGQQNRFAADLHNALSSKSGVRGVAIMSSLPATSDWNPTYEPEGFESGNANQLPRGTVSSVYPGSMNALGMTLLEGRFFDSRDSVQGQATVIIPQGTATKHWPGQSALGQRLRIKDNDLPEGYSNNDDWRTVVGVVGQTLHEQPFGDLSALTVLYVPFAQMPNAGIYAAFTYPGDLAGAMRSLDVAMASVDPDVPAFSMMTYAKRMSINVAAMSFLSKIFVLFGLTALILAGSGIYGVMSNSIAQRTQEIGIKRALGATDQRILRDFFGSASRRMLFGIVPGTLIGGGIGWLLSNLFALGNSLLVALIITMPLSLIAIIFLATWIPTRRALLMEPSDALRHD
jgi:putative ABC transport system permease protein